MVLDNSECIEGPAWSGILLGFGVGFAFNVWWTRSILNR